MTGAAPALRLAEATFAYDGRTPALTGVDLALEPGQALALIGPNGAGKSTFLKGCLGLIPAISGEVEVLGEAPRRAARRVGYMPQTDEIDPEFPVTLRQVVMMGRYRGLGPFRWPAAADRKAAAAALERVGLADQADAHFGSLSGGQQQRGMLARAIVGEPRLLMLDEPFNGLDRVSRASLLELLRELRAHGSAIVVSTHDFEIATEACTHALLLNRCQIAAGPVAETLTSALLEETFGHATADDEAHAHFSHGHGHYHDTGFRGIADEHGPVEAHLPGGAAATAAAAGPASGPEGRR
ncbi:putative ABC transporter ATP-binding protein [Pseudoclavibacter triregionum]|nr:putative ABC transporter ATP-binding protein [Pseudoclavibacter triregionum]